MGETRTRAQLDPGATGVDTETVRPRHVLVAALAVIASTGSIVPAGAVEDRVVEVEARDDYFLPSLLPVRRGTTVVWDFGEADRSHTVTDRSGMGLFDSGIVAPGGPSFQVRFDAAGTYPYTCTLHADRMNGHVDVPVRLWPRAGRLGRSFRVRWASSLAAEGFVYDVQIKRPGGSWTPWLTGATDPTTPFDPNRRGTFRFRARLRRVSDGVSEWSSGASLIVR